MNAPIPPTMPVAIPVRTHQNRVSRPSLTATPLVQPVPSTAGSVDSAIGCSLRRHRYLEPVVRQVGVQQALDDEAAVRGCCHGAGLLALVRYDGDRHRLAPAAGDPLLEV